MKPIKELLNFSLINIDKPAGPTSFTVSEFVKRQLNLSKTSHMGTLDPNVTGVIPITLGRACRLADFFIKHDKSYVGVLHTHKPQDIQKLQEIINKNFLGKIKQTPPHKSAVKREEREREIYEFKLLEASEDNKDFLFQCKVQGGTYIRKICSDLGDMIGGAHMAELRRTAAGIFNESKIYNLNEFSKAVEQYNQGNESDLRSMLVSAEEAIKQVLESAQVDNKAIKTLYTGKPLFKKDIMGKTPKNPVFALFCGNDFIGVYVKAEKGDVFAKSVFVYN